MRGIKVIVFVCISILVLSQIILGQSSSSIIGKVIDEETKDPVPGVGVTINVWDMDGQIFRVETDKNGMFKFEDFDADEYQYEINAYFTEGFHLGIDPESKYYDQSYKIQFKLQKGKNLFLKPIELKRGVRVEGNVKLWDGTPIDKGDIQFKLKNKDDLTSSRYYWSGARIDNNGHYISPLLPSDVDILLRAQLLENSTKHEAYGRVEKILKLKKGETNSCDVVVPNIATEIKGRIVNKAGIPLLNQTVGISYSSGIGIKTDENGTFCLKHIIPSETELYIRYRRGKKVIKTFYTKKFLLNDGESIFINITVDDDFFNYSIIRNKYK